jgi:hypothetical protein
MAVLLDTVADVAAAAGAARFWRDYLWLPRLVLAGRASR